MAESSLQLSQCIESVRSALLGKEVSAAEVVRTICENHGAKSSPYSDLVRTLTGDLDPVLPFEEWLASWKESCEGLVSVLHTDLALLLTARSSPAVAAAFSTTKVDQPSDIEASTSSSSAHSVSVDQVLRRNLWDFIGDVHRRHELVGSEELFELVENARKTDGKAKTHGRDRAAIVYSPHEDLSDVASWFSDFDRRRCHLIRVRISAEDLATKLADFCRVELEKAAQDRLLLSLRQSTAPGLATDQMLKSWSKELSTGSSTGHRVILLLELDGIAGKTATQACNWLSRVVGPCHDRLIVMVGGFPVHAQLEHPSGVFAYRLQPTDRTEGIGESIANDQAKGRDLLNLTQEVEAIADAIASEELSPPLVVGICGGWGGGKSFVFSLIDERLQAIRTQELPVEKPLHVGHLYRVRFDAWTYSKQNLWASLMDRICTGLEDQLRIEQVQRKGVSDGTPVIPANLAPWEVRDIIDRKVDEDGAKHPPEEVAKWSRALENGADLRDILAGSDEKAYLEQEKRLLNEVTLAKETEKRLLQERNTFVDKKLAAQVARDLAVALPADLLAAIGVKEKDIKALQGIGGLRNMLQKDRTLIQNTFTAFRSPLVAILSVFGFAAIGLAFVQHQWALPVGLLSVPSALAAAMTRFLGVREKVRDAIQKVNREAQEAAEKARQSLIDEFDDKDALDDASKAVVEARRLLEEHRGSQRNSQWQLRDIQDFLSEIRQAGMYREHLGLMHQVQEHLEQLSLLINQWHQRRSEGAAEDHPFPRGRPRVVLVIDDIDRCPPAKVVEVLEAAQLLVKTPLFVVLIALDLRYVTRAIEARYPGILFHDEHPTGLDYIEKIVQLAYQVRPIAEDSMAAFFHGQWKVKAKKGRGGEDSLPAPNLGDSPPRTITIPEVPMVQRVVEVEEEEFRELVGACKPLRLTPRSAKRIANVYKIWKLLWSQRGGDPGVDIKQSMVGILALSTVRLRLARHALRELSAESRLGTDEPGTTLQSMFLRLAKELKEPGHIQDLFEQKRVLPPSISTRDISPENLSLLISFSFVGDDDPRMGAQKRAEADASLPSELLISKGADDGGSDPDSMDGESSRGPEFP